MKTAAVTVVVAWTVDDVEVVKPGQPDIGVRPVLRDVKVPKAVTWALKGGSDDIAKAHRYAAQNDGYHVFTYPTSERDPLGRARRDVTAPECSICRNRHGLEIIHACE